ncbi:hypothetical protein LCGC14_1500610 [marine sediment metagenome]|uniref:Uncharacterized protein n=1 Tax=marine sediment metagenome TaxID=412755 RepID=A0A0F9M5M7_9ZZZZ
MPQREVEALQNGSSDDQIKAAISSCIASEVRAGMPQDQATAMCHEQIRGKTGGRPAAPGGNV